VRIKHGYDRVGNRLYREDVAATNAGKAFDELYSYDGMNQVIDMQRGTLGANKASIVSQYKNWEEQFTFDATGNFANYKQDANGDGTFDLNQNRVHNKVNEITSIAGSTSYVANDKNGNMIKVSKPDNWSAAYDLVYDAWNRLVTVKSSSTVVASYVYDGTNRRVRKVVGSETRLFYFNKDWQCVEEYVGSTCDVRFVWGLRYVDDLVTYRKGVTDLYVIQDANWNIVALTNAAGVVQERYTYSSFGKLNVFDASFVPKSASIFNLTRSFTGQVLDNETGLMLYRNRVYHPMLGRFLQRDPIGYGAGDVNLYWYIVNRSITSLDSYGLQNSGLLKPPIYGLRPPIPSNRGGSKNPNPYAPITVPPETIVRPPSPVLHPDGSVTIDNIDVPDYDKLRPGAIPSNHYPRTPAPIIIVSPTSACGGYDNSIGSSCTDCNGKNRPFL
jgi:RHS repeat-associated protein